jgi:hypothetical protein
LCLTGFDFSLVRDTDAYLHDRRDRIGGLDGRHGKAGAVDDPELAAVFQVIARGNGLERMDAESDVFERHREGRHPRRFYLFFPDALPVEEQLCLHRTFSVGYGGYRYGARGLVVQRLVCVQGKYRGVAGIVEEPA